MMLAGIGLSMLALGFASKPLYDTFCRVTGYGGTPRIAEDNLSEILDRKVRVSFDANVSDLPWEFVPEQRDMTVQLGQTGLAYYKVKNESDKPMVGILPNNASSPGRKSLCLCSISSILSLMRISALKT